MKMTNIALLICILVHGTIVAECRDIAVLSRDARFVVLDSDKLELRDSGNLWWLGFRHIDGVIPGSDLNRALVYSEYFVDVATGKRIHANLGSWRDHLDPDPELPTIEWYLLQDLGRRYNSQSEVNFNNMADTDLFLNRFSDEQREAWISDSNTLFLHAIDREKDLIHYEFLSEDLDSLIGFVSEHYVTSSQCIVDDTIYMSGIRDSVALDISSGRTETALWVDPLYSMSNISDACFVLSQAMNGERGFYGDNQDYQVVDISTGEIKSEFSLSTSNSRSYLFANGTRWLMQHEVKREGRWQDPTPEFTLVDTDSGEILLERELDIGNAIIPYSGDSRRFCSSGSDQERIVAIDGLTIYLIDAFNLIVLASVTLPFEGGFYAF